MKFFPLILLFIGCVLMQKKGGKEIATHELPNSAIEVFEKFGCKDCHTLPPTGFTEYGKEMISKGYGCVSLQSLALKHKLKGEAREVFIKNGCVKCHDLDGRGFGDKNLTSFGLKINERNLGCVGTFEELLGEVK
jgi:cytochrome c2